MAKNNFSKILVCVDGSKYSELALSKAISLADKYSSKLFLVNVIDEHLIDFWNETEYAVGTKKPQTHLKKDSKIMLEAEKMVKKYAKKIPTKIESSKKILVGDISNEIVNYADKAKIDLIIVGVRGLGKFKKLLLGSISSKISDHSSCSVLIIK